MRRLTVLCPLSTVLVVCDLSRFEVHTNFTGTAKRVYDFDLAGPLRKT
jgi:hypothetical protein